MRRPQLYYNEKLRVSDRELIQYLNYSKNAVYRVTWIGDPKKNWLVTKENVGQKSFKTKSTAIKYARQQARKDRPSVVVVEYKKNSKFGQSGVADWTHYSSR